MLSLQTGMSLFAFDISNLNMLIFHIQTTTTYPIMFQPYSGKLEQITFVYAHCGRHADKGNRLYAIAATTLSAGQDRKQFSSLINYPKFTARDRYRSNISKKDLKNAPDIAYVKQEFHSFVAKSDVIITLDLYGDMTEMAGMCHDMPTIDLRFAVEFFLPELSSITIGTLNSFLGNKDKKTISSQPEEINTLAIQLVQFICGSKLSDSFQKGQARAIRAYLKKSDTLFGDFFLALSHSFQQFFGGLFKPISLPDNDNWQEYLTTTNYKKEDEKDEEIVHKSIKPGAVHNLYKSITANKTMQFRQAQADYSQHIVQAFNDSAILTIEAGTGTGKTLGYLLPTMEFLTRNPKAKVAVSTYTKSLQQQIFHKEIFFIKDKLKMYQNISVALLKGKSSYICTMKLFDAYSDSMTGKELLSWLYLVNLTYHFREADIDSIGIHIKKYLDTTDSLLNDLPQLSSRSDCPPSHTGCPAQIVTAEAAQAHLIITNHSKLALLSCDPLLKGKIRNYIIDEANHFEKAVRNANRDEAVSREAKKARSALLRILKRYQQLIPDAAQTKSKEAFTALEGLDAFCNQLRECFAHLGSDDHHEKALLPNLPLFRDNLLPDITDNISAAVRTICRFVDYMEDRELWQQASIVNRTQTAIIRHRDQLREFAAALDKIVNSIKQSNTAASYVVYPRNCSLFASYVDIAEIIQNSIYVDRDSVIYTSATLLDSERKFKSFYKIVGLDRKCRDGAGKILQDKPIIQKVMPSPFSRKNRRIIVADDSVSGGYDNKKNWYERVFTQIPKLIRKNNGATLVLMASYEDLNVIVEKVEKELWNSTYPLYFQEKGKPTQALCEQFRQIKESVLFGVDTFWHGIDFKGDTLTQVIIPRIPFLRHDEAIQMARKNMLPEEDYFARYYYDVQITLEQGIGRLIRSHTDKGMVVFLDERIRNMGRRFLSS